MVLVRCECLVWLVVSRLIDEYMVILVSVNVMLM